MAVRGRKGDGDVKVFYKMVGKKPARWAKAP